jgi:hypothetical protein
MGILMISILSLSGCQARSDDSGVVRVEVGGFAGSGVIIEVNGNQAVVATAAHVLGKLSNGSVDVGVGDEGKEDIFDGEMREGLGNGDSNFRIDNGEIDGEVVQVYLGGEWRSCTDVWRSGDADLGFLWVKLTGEADKGSSEIVAASIDKHKFDLIAEGDAVIVRGYEEGSIFREQAGVIQNPWIFTEDFHQYMLWGTAEVYPGMSGGGVFNEEGYLLGILCGNNEEGDIAVLPLSIIQAQYEGVRKR